MANRGINEEILYQKYIIEKKSIAVVANELELSVDTIHKNLKKFGLNRNKSDAQKLKCERQGVHNQFELDINKIKQLYLELGLNTYEVAKILKCSQYKVWKTLKKYHLTRNVSSVLKNRIVSSETKKKLRINQIKRIKQAFFNGGQIFPNYNKKSINIIEMYGKNNGYTFKHAENGGEYYIEELGYWIDAYDENKNTVLEFDEKHHKYLKDKDNNRQIEIINKLKCDFIRINENGEEILKIEHNGK